MKRGYCIRMGGDQSIATALAAGICEATRPQRGKISPRAQEALRNAAFHRRSPEELEAMIAKARYDYGQDPEPCKLTRGLLALYGLLCYAVSRAYHSQELVLGRKERHVR